MPEGRNQNRPGCLRYATARPHLRASSGHRKPPRRRLCGVGASALDRRPQENPPYNNMLHRSKIFIVTGVQIAVSSVGAPYHSQHLHANYIHILFAVQGRHNLIRREYNDAKVHDRHRLWITPKLLSINNMPDHFHILIGQKPNVALSNLVRNPKAGSSGFINGRRWVAGRFSWQEGFGAFSYFHSQLSTVTRYIQNQEHSSSTQELQRRIRRAVETLQCAARSTIPFPSRQFRLDAAPTELTAF